MSWWISTKVRALFRKQIPLNTEKILREVWREHKAREEQIRQALEGDVIFLCQHCERPLFYNEKTFLLECPTPQFHPQRKPASFPGYKRRYERCETHLLSEEDMRKHLHKEC